MSDALGISQVTVLHGHVSPGNAYVALDCPGGKQRCQMRFWLETSENGPRKDTTRFVYQAANPRRAGVIWNKPRRSSPARWMVMYLDHDRHGEPIVQYLAPRGFWVDPALADMVRLCGAYDQLTTDSRDLLDALTTVSKQDRPADWAEYEQRKQALAAYYTAQGQLPQRDGNGMVLGGYLHEWDRRVLSGWVLAHATPSR